MNWQYGIGQQIVRMEDNILFSKLKLPDFKVATRCITYNHAPYIRDALKGFVIQETTFPFLVVIIDDASTDGEQNVIEKYMKEEFSLANNSDTECWEHELSRFIYARHPQNKNCYFVVILLKRNLFKEFPKKKALYGPWMNLGKYWAECEGDDYWTDSSKLQMQVDFMESHPDYSASIHNAYHVDAYGNIINTYKIEPKDGSVPTERIILGGGDFCATNSILYRPLILQSAPQEVFSQYVSDYPFQMYLAFVGKVYYFSKVMSAYRVGVPGSWSNRQYYMKNFEDRKKIWVKEKKLLNDMDRISEYKYHKLFLQKYYRTVFSDSVRYKKMFRARYYWFKIDHPMVLYGIKNFRYVFGGYEFSLLKEYVKHICRWMAGQQKA